MFSYILLTHPSCGLDVRMMYQIVEDTKTPRHFAMSWAMARSVIEPDFPHSETSPNGSLALE
jgi:hypothetical protein